jgi:hypothetical protein
MRVLVDLIRGLAVVVVLGLLMFCSFAINPGMFGWFSRDYARIADAYAPERAKLLDRRIGYDSELKDRRRDLAEIDQKLTLTRARLGNGKDAELQADLDQLLDLKTTEEQQVAELQKSVAQADKDIADIDRVVDRVQNSAETVYLAVRCVALGALGAAVQTLVAFLARRRLALLFRYGNVERAFAAMMIGALAVVAAFSAFHTREVTIFDTAPDLPDLHPDFWRVTVLGLVVGALASWIFQAVTAGDRRFLQPGLPARPAELPPAAPAPVAAAAPPPAPVAPPPAAVPPAAPPAPAVRPAVVPVAAAVDGPPVASALAPMPTPPPLPPAAPPPAAAPLPAAAPGPLVPPPAGEPVGPRPPIAATPPAPPPLPATPPAPAAPAAAPMMTLVNVAPPPAAPPPAAPPAANLAAGRPPLPPIPEAPPAKPEAPAAAPAAAAGRWPPIAPAGPAVRPATPTPAGTSAGTAAAKWPPPLPGTVTTPVPPTKQQA